jgi:AraC family transcriptional regulator, positive regulator of tynA and feaB
MKPAFSTKTVHARDRLAFWREEASKLYVTHEFSTRVGRNFQGTIGIGSLGNVALASFECDECEVMRTLESLKSADDDDVLLCRIAAGTVTAHQDGRDVVAFPGDVYLLDPRRPFTLEVGAASSLVLKVPRVEMEARLGDLAAFTALLLPRGQATSALASDFLSMAVKRADDLDPSVGVSIAQQVLDLVAIAFGARVGTAAKLSTPRLATLTRLKSVIETRVCNPELKLTDIAAAAGISVRYANALLAQENTSLERFIMLRRLQRCRQALEDPSQLGRTVGDIAYSCGFADLSHFSRRYKAQFGCSPGESRPPRR